MEVPFKYSRLLHPKEKNRAKNKMRIGFNNRVQILEDMVAHTQAATGLLLASFSPRGSGTKIGPQFGVINSKRTRMNISLENLYVDI